MKNKYITTQILLACQSKPAERKKDVHMQLAETIAERKQIMQQLELIRWRARIIAHLNFTQAA